MSIPFCGGELPDLPSDEFHCKHLRVVYVTDESKYLRGDETEDKSVKKTGGGESSRISDSRAFIQAVKFQWCSSYIMKQRQAIQLTFIFTGEQLDRTKRFWVLMLQPKILMTWCHLSFWVLTSPKGLMVTMLYEAGSLSTRHVSVNARMRLTGSYKKSTESTKISNNTNKTDTIHYTEIIYRN